MNLKHLALLTYSAPLLPLLYYQGKRIRASVPKLPEAKGTSGFVTNGPEEKSILFVGESTIAGVGADTHEEGFCGTFAKTYSKETGYSVKWHVYAKSGYTARKVRKILLPKITEESPDLIVIGLGGNDAFTFNSPAKWIEEIDKIIQELQDRFPSAEILFANMPPIKEFPAFTLAIKSTIGNLVEILGTELNKLVQKKDRVYYYADRITLKKWMAFAPENSQYSDFYSDGVHPSKLTYQVWSEQLAKYFIERKTLDI